MTPNGRRAWRKAARKLRCKMGRRWRSQREWVHGKRWSELVPDLEAHRAHITGTWFKRHGFQSFDAESSSRHYIGLWGSANGETIGFVESASSITARSLVGMTMGARKRSARRFECPGCMECGGLDKPKLEPWRCYGEDIDLGKEQWRPYHRCPNMRRIYRQHRAKYRIGERLRPCLGCSWCGTDPGDRKDGRWTECDGSGVLPAKSTKAKRPA